MKLEQFEIPVIFVTGITLKQEIIYDQVFLNKLSLAMFIFCYTLP